MQKAIRILVLLIAAQIILIGATWMLNRPESETPGGKLLSFDASAVDRIEVASQTRQATLARIDGDWIMPEHHNLPLRASRIESLLESLQNIDAGWPVATSAGAAERFEVDDGNYQRHLRLFAADALKAELWLGTSPGFRKIHVRRHGDNAIYAVSLALHELPDDPDSWFDKSLLAINDDIEAIHSGGFGVEREGEKWQFSPLVADATADSDAVQRWVDRFGSLTVGDALSVDAAAGALEREFTIRSASATETLKVYRDGESWRISGSAHDGLFELPGWVADPLLEASIETLSAPAPAPEHADDDTNG